MSFFDTLTQFPEDPILSLPIIFAADPRPNKVNLGIGSYKDAEGLSFVLSSVKRAEEAFFHKERNKEYLPIDGDPLFLKLNQELLFGASFANAFTGAVFSAQTLGGTGGLRLAGDFLAHEVSRAIFIPTPTWPNHKLIFNRSNLKIHQYRYYDETSHRVDFAGMCADVIEMPPGSILLLHVTCHNPTGVDPSFEQWQKLSELVKKQKIIPLFDFAYQGFKDSVEEDARVIRYFASQGHEMLVANSLAKNFGLYGERIGALTLLTHHKEAARKASSQIKQFARSNYSSPPRHGAQIVSTILQSDSLKSEWLKELANMRDRLSEMRHTLMTGLQAKDSRKDWSFLSRQHGFFSFCGLSETHVQRLAKGYGIYMPNNGRINVAGLNGHNMDYVIDAILEIIHS